MHARRPRLAAALALALAAGLGPGACAAVVDPDRFRFELETGGDDDGPPGAQTPYQDLAFDMVGWVPHVGQQVGLRLVDSNNIVAWRAVVAPLSDASLDRLYARRVVPRGGADDVTYRLEFYADNDGTGDYSGLPSAASRGDHAWRLNPLQDSPEENVADDDVLRVTYVHNTAFSDIDVLRGAPAKPADVGGAATFRLRGLEPFVNKMLEARVVEAVSGRAVGLYRLSSLRAPAADFALPGVVIEVGAEYRVDLYVDANGDRAYQDPAAPGGDYGYRFALISSAEGLLLDADLSRVAEHGVDVGSFDGD